MKKISFFIITASIIYFIGNFISNNLIYKKSLEKINNIKGVETCNSISPKAYETFLIFNPPNYQTYYFMSECYQKIAIETRDQKLCDKVKERKSLFFNGSGISKESCLFAIKNQN